MFNNGDRQKYSEDVLINKKTITNRTKSQSKRKHHPSLQKRKTLNCRHTNNGPHKTPPSLRVPVTSGINPSVRNEKWAKRTTHKKTKKWLKQSESTREVGYLPPFLDHMSGLQEVLGRHLDVVVPVRRRGAASLLPAQFVRPADKPSLRERHTTDILHPSQIFYYQSEAGCVYNQQNTPASGGHSWCDEARACADRADVRVSG